MSIVPDPNDVGSDSHDLSPIEERLPSPLARYRPQIPEQYWDAIRPFVYNIMADVGPVLDTERALELMSVLVRFGLWVWQSSGHELRRELVFDTALIEQCFAQLAPSLTSNALGTYRSRIRMVQRVLRELQDGSYRISHLSYQPARVLAPYTDKELIGFRSWARGQNTRNKRRDAQVLLGAGAGAGLTTEDLVRLRVNDVLIGRDGVVLCVKGRRAREVPVLAEWEDLIIEAVGDIESGRPLFGVRRTSYNNNAVSAFTARSAGRGPKPSLPRLRATWICTHLGLGTPILCLRRASGTDGLDGFNRYLSFVEEPDLAEYRRAMRTPRSIS
ncbi:hypothetical protein [Ferrimicrobium sp.]|uniref:hypothetical protein n=1 Tax=Ferrimicrobium sp. TaxID=2926050 RepID=UPI00261517E5|nr:hypothetical protein [Ferrimicrobium sp.]